VAGILDNPPLSYYEVTNMSRMTIGECKKAALRLLNQYSIAGTTVPITYNDQADDIERMLDLINDAQMEIAKTNRPIEETFSFNIPKVESGTPDVDISITMPEEFIHAISITFIPLEGKDRRTIYANDYNWIGDSTLLLPNRPAGTYTILYSRYPVYYDSDTPDTTELDNTPDTHVIIPYYVAAMIAQDQNPKQYLYLYNRWETGLSRLNIKPAHAVSTQVTDVYGFDNFRGVF